MRGAAWMLGLRWAMRFAGLISTAILARLLTPADFGIMAVAMIVFELIAVLRASGVEAALIRLPDVEKRHYDTAWTVETLLGVVIAILLVSVAPFAATHLEIAEIKPILWCLAAMSLLASLANTGMIEYRKDLALRRHFLWIALSRLIGVVATIAAAIILRNYWALVIGMVAQTVANLALSYILHPLRPRFSMAAKDQILGFSFWSLVQAFSAILWRKMDQIVLAGTVSTARLGQYNRASELGEMISREIVSPLAPIALSAYSMIQAEADRLRRGLTRGVGLACVLGYPAGIGAAVLAPDLVRLVLGDQWGFASDLLQILALFVIYGAVREMIEPLLLNQGRVRLLAGFSWTEVALLAGTLTYLTTLDPVRLDHIALARIALGAGFSLILAYMALRPYPGLWADVAKQISRPLLAALIMAALLVATLYLLELNAIVSVAVRVPLGAITYFAALFAIWWLAGRPDGAEREIVDRIQIFWRRQRNNWQ